MFGQFVIVGLLAVLVLAGDIRSSARALGHLIRYLLPVVLGILMYAVATNMRVTGLPTQPGERYVGGFAVLLCAMLAASVRLRPARPLVRRTLALATIAICTWGLVVPVGENVSEVPRSTAELPSAIARSLNDKGITPGMSVATIGRPDRHVFWARLSRVRIIADVPDADKFWSATDELQHDILVQLARTGAQDAVVYRMPESALARGWVVAGRELGVLDLTAMQ